MSENVAPKFGDDCVFTNLFEKEKMVNMGVEPMTLALLAPRSNQLS
jgi:hypothetical protein